MHTRHCPRHVLVDPPAHFSGIYVTATRSEGVAEGLHRRWVEGCARGNRGWASFQRGVQRDAKETGQRDGDYAAGLLAGWGGGSLLPANETSPSKTTLATPASPTRGPVCPFYPLVLSIGRPHAHTPLVSIHSRSWHRRWIPSPPKKGRTVIAIGESEWQLAVLWTFLRKLGQRSVGIYNLDSR